MYYKPSFSIYAMSLAFAMATSLFCSCSNKSANTDSTVDTVDEKVTDKQDDAKGTVTELTTEEFITTIHDFRKNSYKWDFKCPRPTVIDFYATWCGPCRKMEPIFEKAAAKYAGKVDFYRVDIDKNKELAEFAEIESIPTIIFISKGDNPMVVVGGMTEEALDNRITKLLNNVSSMNLN